MRSSVQGLHPGRSSGHRRLARLIVVCFAPVAIGVYFTGVSVGAEPAPTPSATTEPATVDGQSEATLTATVNDQGNPSTYRFQVQPDGEWFNETPEEAFSRSVSTGYGTQSQAVPGSLESQRVSAAFAPPPQHAHYAYRVVLETTGSEPVFGQPLAFEVLVKPLPRPPLENPLNESPSGTQAPSQDDPPRPSATQCRVPSLKALTLKHARHLIAATHCGTLKVGGRQATGSSKIISQAPRAYTTIARTARVTVWLRSTR
jgi:hypothetical protein